MKSFVIYGSWATMINGLTKENAGDLIKAICAFETGEEGYQIEDSTIKAVFEMIKPQLIEDAEKYESRKKSSKKANSVKKRKAKADNRLPDTANRSPEIENRKPEDSKSDCISVSVSDSVSDSISTDSKESYKKTLASSDSNRSPLEVKLADVAPIPLIDGTEYQAPEALVAEYVRLYPNVDVKQQFNEMRAWCLSHEKNQKTRRGVKTFINGWLAREQDRPSRPTYNQQSGMRMPVPAYINQQQESTKKASADEVKAFYESLKGEKQ